MPKLMKEYALLVNYGQGWEYEITENSLEEIKQRQKEYQENCPEYPTRIELQRIRG